MTEILATGTSSADALSGGAFCGHKGSVFLMTRDNATSENYIIQNNIIPNKMPLTKAICLVHRMFLYPSTTISVLDAQKYP